MSARPLSAESRETKRWLQKAAAWRCLSLLFQLPTRESRRELRRIAKEVESDLRLLAESATRHPLADMEMEFHRVLGAGGIPTVESSYDDNALAGRGPLLADVRAFYEAFSYQPRKKPAELPDHVAVELDFLAYLALKIAFALHEGKSAESDTALQAYGRFLDQHVRDWIPQMEAQMARADSPVYGPVAQALCQHLDVAVHS